MELVGDVLVGDRRACALLNLLLYGQRGHILLEHVAQLGLVVVANHGELIGGGIGGALLGNLQDAVVVDLLQVAQLHGHVALVVLVEGDGDRVAECSVGREGLVLELQLVVVHQVVERLLVFVDVGEVEIHQLEHGLHVFRCRVTADGLVAIVHLHRYTGNLTSQGLAQLGVREVAQTAALNHVVEHVHVHIVALAIEGRTALTNGRENHLVFLVVGLLGIHLHTVREGVDLIVELVAHLLALDAAFLGQSGHDGLVLHIVNVCLHLVGTSGGNSLAQSVLGGVGVTLFLVEQGEHHHVSVGGRHQLFHVLVDGFQRNGWNNLLEHHILIVERWDRCLVEEVAHILIDKLAAVALVFVAVDLVERAQVVGLRALILCSGEAELSGATALAQQHLQCLFQSAVLGNGAQGKCLNSLREQVVAVFGLSAHVRTVRILGQLSQTGVEHAHGTAGQVVRDEIHHRVLQRVGESLVLEHQLNDILLLLLVLLNHVDSLGIVGHHFLHHRCRVLGHLDVAEDIFDLLLNQVDIHVAHHHDGLVVGAVPLLVVVAQSLGLEVVDNLHQSDRHAVTVFAVGIELGQTTLKHTLRR